ncbi:MAG: ABC transporter ATP-binding protein [Clostridiaceae bacterium]|nr:ABC transporter ATP-binding protein [Clostridiaceae bacterium]
MIRELARHIKEYRTSTVITPLLVLGEVFIEITIPFLISKLISEVMYGTEQSALLRYGLILAVCALMSLTLGTLAGFSSARASSGLAKNLRQALFKNIQTFSFSNVDRFETSSLITRLTTDVEFVRQAFMVTIRTAIRAPLMLIFAFIMGFVIGGKLAWIFCFTVPILGFGLWRVISTSLPLFRQLFRKYDKLNLSVQENVKGMRVVKSFVREQNEVERFSAASEDLKKDFTRIERIIALLDPLMQFCLNVVMLLILSYGSYLVISTRGLEFDVGQISALLTYSFMMLMSLMMLSMVFAMLVMAQESGRRIVEVLNEESDILSAAEPHLDVADGSIVFDNVFFKYAEEAERFALENINLEIRSGEVIGVIGATGSAKSTLVQLIPRLYDVTSGAVLVGGVDVRNYDLEVLRRSVAMVLQKNVLFSGTIADNLRWGDANATDEMLQEACKMAQAHNFITSFPEGYNTHIEQGGSNVSGGQNQRICIARALLARPKVLILDDSTSAVDMQTDAKLRAALRSYIPKTTKIIIAQRLASVQDADRIVVMNDGRIDAVGSHDELLLTNDIYREIYESQTRAEVLHGQ